MAEDVDLGKGVASLPWVVDGADGPEFKALTYLSQLSEKDVGLTRTVFSFSWTKDSISDQEANAILNINSLAHRDLSLARNVVALPWVIDDITETEWSPLGSLSNLKASGNLPSDEPVGFRWVVDDMTEPEWGALYYLGKLSEKDSTLGKHVIRLPWVVDDITSDENWALRYLSDFLDEDSHLAKKVVDMPFFNTSFHPHAQYALRSLVSLSRSYPEKYLLLVEQEWFLDGLTDEEAALVAVLDFQATSEVGDFGKLIKDHFVYSKEIDLPLAGEIWSIGLSSREKDLDLETTQQVEDAVVDLEDFLAVPFPAGELIVLYGFSGMSYLWSTQGDENLGRNMGSHIIIKEDLARGKPTSDANRIIIHEVAHHYWGGEIGPSWLTEGGADFLASAVFHRLHGESLTERIKNMTSSHGEFAYCKRLAVSTVQKLLEIQGNVGMEAHRASNLSICDYYLGEYLLLNVYETIGDGPFRAAFKEMYLLSQREEWELTEQDIYDIFLNMTPSDRTGEFHEVYSQVHGGSFHE